MAAAAGTAGGGIVPGQEGPVLGGPVIQIPDAAAVKRAVLDRLRRAITVGEMPPGSRLRQTQLAAALGVSRMPVRDAISDLVAEGLAVPASGGGAVVSALSQQDMHDVYAVRATLEVFVVRELAGAVGSEQIRQLRSICLRSKKLIANDQREALTALDKEFHWALYRATGNRFLESALTPMWAQVDRIMYQILQMQDYIYLAWDEHAAIVDAIEDQDPDAAGRLMQLHLHRAAERLIEEAG
ncbi:GntR family transcriptional regulator [Ornithinimicrobium avium]|nr:GntR family transcriptional regulator [Ornithinimicrobium avium]